MSRPLLRLSHKGLVLVSLPLFFEIVFIAILLVLLQQADHERRRELRSKTVLVHASNLMALLHEVSMGPVAYGFTGSQQFVRRYEQAMQQMPTELNELKELVAGSSKEESLIAQLEEKSTQLIGILSGYKSALDTQDRVELLHQLESTGGNVRATVDKLTEQLNRLMSAEQSVANESPEAQERWSTILVGFLLVGTLTNLVLAVCLALFFFNDIVRRLITVRDNSFKLAQGMPLTPLLSGTDEIAQLDRAFHDMADVITESAKKERAMIENTLDVICWLDESGRFKKVSNASLRVWGYSPDELVGREFVNIVAPEDRDTARHSVLEHSPGTTTVFPKECRVLRKDGGIISLLWSSYWSESERSLFCVAHDITERKKIEDALRDSEARIRSIISDMPVGLAIVDMSGAIELTNPKIEQLFGYSSNELVGRNLLTLFKPAQFPDFESFCLAVTENQIGNISEWQALRKSEQRFPIELTLNEFWTRDGLRFLVVIIDVTELHEVDRLKREFVSIVSHELRTPLTSIRTSLTMVSAGVLGEMTEKMKKAIQVAERNTIRLISLINDILDLQKLESNKLDIVFASVPVSLVIERSLESVRSFSEQQNVALVAKNNDFKAYVDEDRIVQVLVNLLSNAIKFSPSGGKVTISVSSEPGFLKFTVEDQGRGIPEQFRSLIFERFQQVQQSDSREKGGSGLGLAICKAIVEQHCGTIGCDSKPGEGSTFWFKVPEAPSSG